MDPTPSSIDNTTAAHQVFGITELLENILTFAPVRTIVQSESVSRKWRDVIQGSMRLQRKTYRLATPSNREPGIPPKIGVNPIFEDFVLNVLRQEAPAWQHENSSWQRMQVFSPAARHCDLRILYCSAELTKGYKSTTCANDGVTLADVRDAVEKLKQREFFKGSNNIHCIWMSHGVGEKLEHVFHRSAK